MNWNARIAAPVVIATAIACGGKSLDRSHQLEAIVASVHDGDSLRVTLDDRTLDIRLDGIDAPELSQDFGLEARDALIKLTLGKRVSLVVTGQDRFGRTLAQVRNADGVSANEELLRLGLAWHFKRYSNSAELDRLESSAREGRRGLWTGPHPKPPWEHRSRSAAPDANATSVDGPVRGNRRSKRYHLQGCEGFDKVSQRNRVGFPSESAATEAGYVKAGNCR